MTAEDSGEINFVSKQIESIAHLEIEGAVSKINKYICNNLKASFTSSNILSIFLTELPESIVRPLRDRTALEKHRVILECTVSSPRCDVTWYKEGEELESSEHMEIIEEGCYHKLVINQVALEDEGTYSIEVGEHTSRAKLMVEGKNQISISVCFHMNSIKLFCCLTSQPSLSK